MKKMMSLFLAMAMAFALAIPAFAQANPGTQNVTVAGAMATPTIQIEAPSDVVLTLNPYQMKYNGDIKLLKDKTDQILSLPAVFVNKTDGQLNAALTATATLPSATGDDAVTLVDGAIENDETAKKVWLKMQFGMVTDKAGGTWDGSEPTEVSFDKTKKTVEYKVGADANPKALSIPATDGKIANYFAFKFSGSMTKNPTKSEWKSTDTIGVAVVITLTPVNPNGSGS